MKLPMLTEITDRIKSSPKLRFKLKIFAGLFVCLVLALGGLALWAAIGAVNYVGKVLPSADVIKESVTRAETEVLKLPVAVGSLNTSACWEQAKRSANLRSLIEKPLAEHFQSMKLACYRPTNESRQTAPNATETNLRTNEGENL